MLPKNSSIAQLSVSAAPDASGAASPAITLPTSPDAPKPAPEPTVEDRLKIIADQNTAATTEIAQWFGPKRWDALMKQAAARNLTRANIESMCGNLRRTRREWEMVAKRDKAALILAALHLLIECGSKPSKADEAALESALSAAPDA